MAIYLKQVHFGEEKNHVSWMEWVPARKIHVFYFSTAA